MEMNKGVLRLSKKDIVWLEWCIDFEKKNRPDYKEARNEAFEKYVEEQRSLLEQGKKNLGGVVCLNQDTGTVYH